jgi:glycosyltransferase involved in cell wall biosynthesis
MDVFCLPSFGDEGVPQGLMQAMACGVPAVSTPIGAIAEALQDGTTGLMTPPRDAERLAVTLRRLLSDASLRDQFSKASVEFARDNFGIDVMLDGMERVFMQALTRRSGR